jgi:hypothetical protein
MKIIHSALLLCAFFPSASYAQMTWYPPAGTWSGGIETTNEIIMDSLNNNTRQSYE